MYILYGNNKGKRILDISENEEDIKDTLGVYMGCLDTIDYEIREKTDNCEKKIATIKSYEDYIDYKYTGGKILTKKRKRGLYVPTI